jgi:hypothetical protein
MTIPEVEFAVLARHAGEWRGTYLHIGPDAAILDQHSSHLVCSVAASAEVVAEGDEVLRQTNTYTWADGRSESIEFIGIWRNGAVRFDNDRIIGHLSRWDENTLVLHWRYKADPAVYLYELIQLAIDGSTKTRTWHWMNGAEVVKRTLIHERKSTL